MADAKGKIFVQDGRRAEATLENSSWILFPDGKNYLLRKYISGIKMVPSFSNGEVHLDMQHKSPDLAKAVEAFAFTLEYPQTNDEGFILILAGAGLDMYIAFLKMLKELLLANYNWAEECMAETLTFTPKEYSTMLKPILTHVFFGV